eukprot:1125221-Karenia_brevis.AAC.1
MKRSRSRTLSSVVAKAPNNFMATSFGRNIGAANMISGCTSLETKIGISMDGVSWSISMASCWQNGLEIKWHRH